MLKWIALLFFACSVARADAFVGVGGGLYLPPGGGSLGGTVYADAAYDWDLEPLALAAGLRASSYLGPDVALGGLALLRATLPRPFASPYLQLGAGVGRHDELAFMFQVGAGLSFAISERLTLSGEGGYVQLAHSLRSVYLGPGLQLHFAR